MNKNYKLTRRVTVYILLVIPFLQSCDDFPKEEKNNSTTDILTTTTSTTSNKGTLTATTEEDGDYEEYEEYVDSGDLPQAEESILKEKVNRGELIKIAEFMATTEVESGFSRIKADIEKVNRLWELNSSQIPPTYIPTEYTEIIDKRKYLNSRRDLLAKPLKVNCPPKIEYNKGKVSFDDGRNRFANLRDMKAPYIYVDISFRSEFFNKDIFKWSGEQS